MKSILEIIEYLNDEIIYTKKEYKEKRKRGATNTYGGDYLEGRLEVLFEVRNFILGKIE